MKKALVVPFVLIMLLFNVIGSFAQEPETIKIGVIYALTGGSAEDGKNQRSGHELAVAEINEAGGIASMNGAKIELIFADHQANPELGMSEAERLIKEENVSMIMGCFESDVTIPVAKVCERNKVPFYTPQTVGDALTESGLKYVFRQCPKASWWARSQLEFIKDSNEAYNDSISKIGLLYGDTVYGNSVAAGWKKYAPELGFDIVADISYPVGVSNLSETILSMKAKNVEAVVALGDLAESMLLIRASQEFDFAPKAFVGMGGGFTNPSFVKNLGPLSNYIFALNDWIPTVKREGAAEANQRYRDVYGKDMMGNAENTYVSMYVIKDVLERAGSADRDAIHKALQETDISEGIPTILGPRIKFDETGQNIYASSMIGQIVDGQFDIVWPEDVKNIDAVWPFPGWN